MGRSFDVVVVGGGIAGSTLAGVLARAGVHVLVAEKSPRFRDVVRGEGTLPWGVADAKRLDVGFLFERAGGTDLRGLRFYDEPTVSTIFGVNTSPLAGRDGQFVTSRQIKDRLDKELLGNVSIKLFLIVSSSSALTGASRIFWISSSTSCAA